MATTLKTFIVDAKHNARESTEGYSDLATFVVAAYTASGNNQTEIISCPLAGDRVLLICTKTVAD